MQKEFEEAMKEANKIDGSDIFYKPRQYFSCGCDAEPYYNYRFATAVDIIGKLYSYTKNQNSNYHNGIAYIAEKAGVSRSQVKALRKKMRTLYGFIFRTPYKVTDIVDVMIELLKNKEDTVSIKSFAEGQRSRLYRDMLIEKQYDAIRISANAGQRKVVLEIAGKLEHLTQEYGGK